MNKYENSYIWVVNKLWYKRGEMHTEEIFITDSTYMIINHSSNMIATFLTKFYMYQFRITLQHIFDIPTITNQPHGSGFSFETPCSSIQKFSAFTEFPAMFTEAGQWTLHS